MLQQEQRHVQQRLLEVFAHRRRQVPLALGCARKRHPRRHDERHRPHRQRHLGAQAVRRGGQPDLDLHLTLRPLPDHDGSFRVAGHAVHFRGAAECSNSAIDQLASLLRRVGRGGTGGGTRRGWRLRDRDVECFHRAQRRKRLAPPFRRTDDDNAEAIGVKVLLRGSRHLRRRDLLDRRAIPIEPVERLPVVLVGHLLTEHFRRRIGVEHERVEDRRLGERHLGLGGRPRPRRSLASLISA